MPAVKRIFFTLLLGLLLLNTAIAQSTPQALNVGDSIAAFITDTEVQEWVFTGTAGQVISLSVERFPPEPGGQFFPVLELYAPDGTLLASDSDSGPAEDAMLIAQVLPAAGDYRIVVRNEQTWGSGGFLLSIGDNVYPEGCQTPQGTMEQGEMVSAIMGQTIRYRVFLPPCHEVMQRRYPYVLLMHGSNSDDALFDQLGFDEAIVRGIALKRLPPMALVLPFGSWLANNNTFPPSVSWEDVVLNEILPSMESQYCLQNTRDGRAIGGISRGGFWAFEIAFRHPEVFSVLGGHSPFFDLYHAPPTNNPLDLAMATPPDPVLRIWMDRGKDDYAGTNIDLMHERLQQNKIFHIFQLYPIGQHADDYWSAHSEEYLRFYSAAWTSDYTQLPTCTSVTSGEIGVP